MNHELIDQLRSDIKKLDAVIIDAQNQRGQLRQELAELLCPLTVGQVITLRRNNAKAKILKIGPSNYREYALTVARIKNDGELYLNQQLIRWPEEDVVELQKEGAS